VAGAFKAVKVSEHVYWVGAIDWTIRNFHGYATTHGTTYNAYLIMADRVTLVDTVKAPFYDELMQRVASVVDPTTIDYFVSNHTEMDHSGCFTRVVEAIRPEKIFASPNGKKALEAHFHHGLDVAALKDGETVDLGNMHLTSVLTPMLHWPDSMVTYLDADRVLFSQDGFGLHLASTERFTDELPSYGVWYETAKYYANILMPLSSQVQKVLARLADLNLPIDILANDHGPLWRRGYEQVIAKYGEWAAQAPTRKVVIVYDTMWKSTELMARAIADSVTESCAKVVLKPLEVAHRSDVVTEILDAGGVLVGSPTLNTTMYPTVADFLCYLKGLKPKNKLAAAFGSHGWSGQGADEVHAALEQMKLEMAAPPLKVTYVPNAAALEECRAFGQAFGAKLCQKVQA